MNPAYTILTNPHIINNIIYNHKGLQTPTAKIMNNFFKDYDTKLLIDIYYNDWDECVLEPLSNYKEKLLIEQIKEGYYMPDMSYYDDYFSSVKSTRWLNSIYGV
tara:strand:+ start:4578 stop:4889 length:312 start_codon:yes stop_codon:yes gene_type:complete